MLTGEWLQVEVVDLVRDEDGSPSFGLTLVGDRSTGVIIRSIVDGSPAAQDGRLLVSDHVVQVGGITVFGMSANQVANLLRQCQRARVVVARKFDEKESSGILAQRIGGRHVTSIIASCDLDEHLHRLRERTDSVLEDGTRTVRGSVTSAALATQSTGDTFAAQSPWQDQVIELNSECSSVNPQVESVGVGVGIGLHVVQQLATPVDVRVTYRLSEPDLHFEPFTINRIISVGIKDVTGNSMIGQRKSSIDNRSDQSQTDLLKKEMKAAKVEIIDRWRKILGEKYEVVIAEIEKPTDSAPLGISLEGVINMDSDRTILHHQISVLHADGPAQRTGVLKAFDEILEVNGFRVYGLSHVEVIPFLKKLPRNVLMVVARPTTSTSNSDSNDREPERQPSREAEDAATNGNGNGFGHGHVHGHEFLDESVLDGSSDKLPVTRTDSCPTGKPLELELEGADLKMSISSSISSSSSDTAADAGVAEPDVDVDADADADAGAGQEEERDELLPKAKSDYDIERYSKVVKAQSLEPLCDLAMWTNEMVHIELHKQDALSGLGFSIMQHVAAGDRISTLIRSLVPAGLADLDGRLKPGDKLLLVNEFPVDGLPLETVRNILKALPIGLVRLAVAKPVSVIDTTLRTESVPQPASASTSAHAPPQQRVPSTQVEFEETPVPAPAPEPAPQEDAGAAVALKLARSGRSFAPTGGRRMLPIPSSLYRRISISRSEKRIGLTLDAVDYGINGCIVKHIDECSVVGRDGRVRVNDFILSINNESLRNCTNAKVRDILQRASLLLLTDLSITYVKYADARAYLDRSATVASEENMRASKKAVQVARSRLSPRIFPKFYRPRLTPPPSPRCGSEAGRSLRSEPGCTLHYDSVSEIGISIDESKSRAMADADVDAHHADGDLHLCVMENGASYLTDKPVGTSFSAGCDEVRKQSKSTHSANGALVPDFDCVSEREKGNAAKSIEISSTTNEDSRCGKIANDKTPHTSLNHNNNNNHTRSDNTLADDKRLDCSETSGKSGDQAGKDKEKPVKSRSGNEVEFAWGPLRLVVLERKEGQSLGISIVGGRPEGNSEICSSRPPSFHENNVNAATVGSGCVGGSASGSVDISAKVIATVNFNVNAINTSAENLCSTAEAIRLALNLLNSGIFVKSVVPDSPAGRSGDLNTGDCIIKVNETSLSNVSHSKAVDVLRKAANPVQIWVKSIVEATSMNEKDAAVPSVLPQESGNKK